MVDVTIKLKKSLATVTIVDGKESIDWLPALIAVCTEVEALNAYAKEGTAFPRPIPVNKAEALSGHWENALGDVCTPPNPDGFISVRVPFSWLDLSAMPAQPTTFSFCFGLPDGTPVFSG